MYLDDDGDLVVIEFLEHRLYFQVKGSIVEAQGGAIAIGVGLTSMVLLYLTG